MFILAIAGGIGIGLYGHYTSEATYRSDMLISSHAVSPYNMAAVINSMQKIISDGNMEYLSQQVGVKKEEIARLKSIKATVQEDEDLMEEMKELSIKVQVSVSDPGVLPELSTWIRNYLSNNDYLNRTNTLVKQQRISMIRKLNEEIGIQDSLKKKGALITINTPSTEPNLLNSELISLLEKKQEVELIIETEDYITVIHDFIPTIKPYKKSALSTATTYGVITFMIALFAGLFIELILYTRKLNS